MTFVKGDTINTVTGGTTPPAEIPAATLQPVAETKSDKFVRLATARTKRAIKYIRSIGKLSNSAYEYTPEQIEMIATAIGAEIAKAKDKLLKVPSNQEEFKLR